MNKNYSKGSGKRNKNDHYVTPYKMTEQLLDHVKLRGNILEPACGSGAIVDILETQYEHIDYYDIEKDFFTETKEYATIITNPPYKLANEFIIHAKKLYKNKVIMLLPITYLQGKYRHSIGIYDELKYVYTFSRFGNMTEEKKYEYKGGMQLYAWFVWEKNYHGKIQLEILLDE